MAIQFNCPTCDALLSVEDEHAGKQVKCAHCQQTCTAKAAQVTAIQPPSQAAPKPKADDATAIAKGAPSKRRSDDDEEERERGPRRDIVKPASSFTPVAIVLAVVGVLVAGVFALMCAGCFAGMFFGVAEQRAIVARPVEVVAVNEAPMAVEADEQVLKGIPVDPINEQVKRKDGGEKPFDKKADPGEKLAINTPREAMVRGVVKLQGPPPEMKVDPRIANHPDGKFCMSGPAKQKAEQIWLVGKDNVLANVIVSLAPPPGKKFLIDDNVKEVSKKKVTIDQPFCAFEPHVVALWPETQPLVVMNSAEIPHNIKIAGGPRLGTFDITFKGRPKAGAPALSDEIFLKGAGETVIDASCSMHPWMYAKIALFTHPYFAVTKEDGSFEIANVPIEQDLTVYLWHESNPRKIEVQKLHSVRGVNELKLEYRR